MTSVIVIVALVSVSLCSSNDGNSGSGFNRLCMPFTPDFVNAHDDNHQYGGYLWGAEYQSYGFGIFDLDQVYDRPIACAVCEVSGPETLMIPATTDCPAGWMMEYSGYLMANYYNYRKGEYVCVDKKPQRSSTGHWNTNQDR